MLVGGHDVAARDGPAGRRGRAAPCRRGPSAAAALPGRVPGSRSTRLPTSPFVGTADAWAWSKRMAAAGAPAWRSRRAMNCITSPSWPLTPGIASSSSTKDSAFVQKRRRSSGIGSLWGTLRAAGEWLILADGSAEAMPRLLW